MARDRARRAALITIFAVSVVAAAGVALAPVLSGDDEADGPRAGPTTPQSASAIGGHEHSHDSDGAVPAGTEDGRLLFRLGEGTLLVSEWELDAAPTDAQRAEADRVVAATIEGISRFRDLAAAEAAGYTRFDEVHWLRNELVDDDGTMDPEHPEGLMYVDAPSGGGKLLVAAMYLAPPGVHGPQFGGPDTVWHFHDYDPPMCMEDGAVPLGPASADGTCERGVLRDRSPEMLHVWIANPAGRFEHDMNVTDEVIEATIRAFG